MSMDAVNRVCLVLLPFVLLCSAADTDYMKRSIKRYFSKIRHHSTGLETKKEAKEYIHDEFQRLGLTTTYHSFWNDRDTDKKIKFTNVIGLIKGEKFGQAGDHIVGVGAHYDTAESSPGVDDNGSGLAAMLEAATQVSDAIRGGTKMTNTIIFVAFDAAVYNEHMGGFYFVRDWFNPFLQNNYAGKTVDIRGFIIMDAVMEYNNKENSQTFPDGEMPLFQTYFREAIQDVSNDGFRGNFLMIVYREPKPHQETEQKLAADFKSSWAALGRPDFKLQSFPLEGYFPSDFLGKSPAKYFMESEHRSMWLGGIPTIYVTDSGKLRGEMVKCFHKPCDNVETILTEDNIKFLGKVADVVAKTILGQDWRPATKSPGAITLPGGHTGSRPSSSSVSYATNCNHILLLSLAVVYQMITLI